MKLPLSVVEIERLYQPRGVVWGKEILLETKIAVEFTESCEQNDLAVIGFDGLEFQNGKYVLLIDVIADFSMERITDLAANNTWEKYRTNCNKWTIDLLHQFEDRQGLLVSMVALSRHEWTSPLR